jgi:hypothetical protein
MNFDWTTFLSSLGGAVVIGLGAAYVIVQTFFKKKIEAEIQSRYDETLANINAKNLQELEGFKAGYQKVLDENQIRFSGFYSEQSKAILELNQKFAFLHIALNNMTTFVKHVPKDEVEKQKHLAEEENKTSEAYNNAMRYYNEVKLLLPESLWEFLDSYLLKCRNAIEDYRFCREYPAPSNRKTINTYRNIVKEQLPKIEEQRQRSFHAILNGKEVQDAE